MWSADLPPAAWPFHVTVLHAPAKRLVKRFDAAGRKHGYDKAEEFFVDRRHVESPRAFFDLLSELERGSARCVVRGAPGPWFPGPGRPIFRLLHPQPAYADPRGRRVTPEQVGRQDREAEIGTTLLEATWLPMLVEEATPWVLIDIDGVEFEPDWRTRLAETASWLKLRLPDAFADACCWYQATGGAADPTRFDLGGAAVRMRLGFVLSRALTRSQLKTWLGSIPGLDTATLESAQPIYVGRPLFEGGLADPMPIRSGVLEGLEDVVPVPDDLPAPREVAPRTALVPAAGELGGEGLGLLDCPELDEVLAGISGEAGGVRSRLGRAASAYIRAVGPDQVDVEALAERLAEEARRHRSAGEVAGYNLASLVRWHLAHADRDTTTLHPAAALLASAQGQGEGGPAPEPEALPDFGPVHPDRDAALEELHAGIAGSIESASKRIKLRRELRKRRQAARDEAQAAFLRTVCKEPEALEEDEKRRLRNAKARASRAAKVAFLEEHGLEAMPKRQAILFTGGQGTGKTRAVAQALARLKSGNITVLVPTLAKAEEVAAEIERHQPDRLFVKVWRGRLAPPPIEVIEARKPDGNLAFLDFNRAPSERMCGRSKALIQRAQAAGCAMHKTFCHSCPLRHDCLYLGQIDLLKALDGARIVVAAHETAFLPLPFASELVVVDEDLATKAARVIEIDPARLLDPQKWEGAPGLLEIATRVAAALGHAGEELAALREAGVEAPMLEACAAHLQALHDAAIEAIGEAGKRGASETTLGGMITALEAGEFRKLRALFSNLSDEIRTGRQGTNATRLIRGRRRKVRGDDGQEVEERLDRYVISRPRGHNLGGGTELILLDGTGNLDLNRSLFGEDVQERRHAVPRRGVCIQITNVSNSKRRLLRDAPEARTARAGVGRLIAHLAAVLDGSLLVGCTKQLRETLTEEGALEMVEAMHFGAERGMNSAEGCKGMLVVGREQPALPLLEDHARGFTIAAEEPFVSVLDGKEEGELPRYRRRRRMRDGAEVWAEVRSHPDPFARALLEQVREAGVVQMADRVRAVWHQRLIVLATNLAVDIDVDLLVTQGELMRAAAQAAEARRALADRGWWLRAEPARRGGEGIGRTRAFTLISILLGFRLSFAQFDCLLPSGRNLLPASLLIRLPLVAALRRAAEVHPGLRVRPPEGGVLRECLRRHGLVGTWADLPILAPDLAPDAAAVAAIKDAEQVELAQLKAEHVHATYRVVGRRGRPGVVIWEPARITYPAATLARLLGVDVTVEGFAAPADDLMDPNGWGLSAPTRLVPLAAEPLFICMRCGAPAEPESNLCGPCEWLSGACPAA